MGRHPVNALVLAGNPEDGYTLRGHINGRRVRRQSHDLAALEKVKRLEEAAFERLKGASRTQALRTTWLTDEQLRDAEAAVQRAGGVRLLDCVVAAERVMPKVEDTLCTDARDAWIAELRQRGRFPRTIQKNEARVTAFLKASNEPRYLTELTTEMVRAWVWRGTKGYTPLTDATVLQGWLRWCVRRRLLAVMPFDLDMRDLAERSRSVAKPSILTIEQCEKMLWEARGYADGKMVPYVVLTLWCMLRHAEAVRTAPEQIRMKLAAPVVEVEPRKRGTPSYRQVPIPANVLPLLRSAIADGKLVAVRRVKKRKVTQPGVYFDRYAWNKIRERAGITDWQENLLRHTGISYRYQQTGDMKLVCREAGNSDETSFRHYLNLPEPGAAAKFYAISE